MKQLRAYHIVILGLILLLLAACHTEPTKPLEKGELPLSMDLAPALSYGLSITQAKVTITRGNFSLFQYMQIEGNTASALFSELEPGLYAIDVELFSDGLLIATGKGTAQVLPGQSATSRITLSMEDGSLEIIVDWEDDFRDARNVLLIGNSYTYAYGGVDMHLQQMVDELRPEWQAYISSRTAGAYTLEMHFNDSQTINAINRGNWDLVILQEQSARPVVQPNLFYLYATKLDAVIKATGAKTGFYMTWNYKNNLEMYELLRDAYTYIGAYLAALVVPAGVSFHNSTALYPGINLYESDNSHPNIAGTYLVSCTMLASIWGLDPRELSYCPAGLDSRVANQLRIVAWNTANNWLNKSTLPKAS